MMEEKKLVEIFDPPMCCPSGLCGPAIDPALLDANEAILRVKKEYPSTVRLERYSLSRQGALFMQNKEVAALLNAKGTDALPVTTMNGKVLKQGVYATYDELKNCIESV
jgi:hypothetical protein